MQNIRRSFPGIIALDNVNLALQAGQISALMGENGAGKSTLIKVLTGIHPPEKGQILLNGQPINPTSTADAQSHGISTVYQEVNLIPELSVAENLYLGREPKKRLGTIDWKTIRKQAITALAQLQIEINVNQPLGSYSLAIQQMVAIARALTIPNTKILILDEPTSSLDEREVAQLFNLMKKLRASGLGIIFITHFIDQVYQITDTITVLRNGHLVGSYPTAKLPRIELIAKMIGRSAPTHPSSTPTTEQPTITKPKPDTPPILQVKNFSRRRSLAPFNFQINAGEIVGLAGLLGSGRTELARLLFALDQPETGTLQIDGHDTKLKSPRAAIARRFGFLPEDRQKQGIIPELSVRENIILALQARLGWLRTINRREQIRLANHYCDLLNIHTTNIEKPLRFLSGGNQQKAILARWLATQPRLLILDEPMRGIDIGAKAEIAQLINQWKNEGLAIIFISSELEEVVANSTRVVVLRDRAKIAELTAPDTITEQNIMQTLASHDHHQGSNA